MLIRAIFGHENQDDRQDTRYQSVLPFYIHFLYFLNLSFALN